MNATHLSKLVGIAPLLLVPLAPAADNYSFTVSNGSLFYRNVINGGPRDGDEIVVGYYVGLTPPPDAAYYDQYDPHDDPDFVVLTTDNTNAGANQVDISFDGSVDVNLDDPKPQLVVFFNDSGTGTQGYLGLSNADWLLGEVNTIVLDGWTESLRFLFPERSLQLHLYDGAGNSGFAFADTAPGGNVPSVTFNINPALDTGWKIRNSEYQLSFDGWVPSGETAAVLFGPWTVDFLPLPGFITPDPIQIDLHTGDVVTESVVYEPIPNYAFTVSNGSLFFRNVFDGEQYVGTGVVVGFYIGLTPPADFSYYDQYDPNGDPDFVVITSDFTQSGDEQVDISFDGLINVRDSDPKPQLVVFFDDTGTGTQGFLGLTNPDWVLGEVNTIVLDEWTESLRFSNRERTLQNIVYDGAGNAGFAFANADPGGNVPSVTYNIDPAQNTGWKLEGAQYQKSGDGWVPSGEAAAVLLGPWTVVFLPLPGFITPDPRSIDIKGGDVLAETVTYQPIVAPPPPGAPTQGVSTADSFEVQWPISTTATSYRLSVATDAGFTNLAAGYNDLDVGNVNAFTITGLPVGTYFVKVTAVNPGGVSAPSSILEFEFGGRLIAISTRGLVTSSNQLIAGFFISGSTKRVLVRAAGPALAPHGVVDPLPDPRVRVVAFSNSAEIASNDDWDPLDLDLQNATTASGSQLSFANGSTDSALVVDLPPAGYTAIVESASGEAGTVLVEIYEVDHSGRLIAISTRGLVTSGNPMIAGFFVSGSVKRLLVRAAGTALAPHGVLDPLPDPRVRVIAFSNSAEIASNDNWDPLDLDLQNATTDSGAGLLFADGSTDSAIALDLTPAGFTAIVDSVTGDSGTVLIEIYEVP